MMTFISRLPNKLSLIFSISLALVLVNSKSTFASFLEIDAEIQTRDSILLKAKWTIPENPKSALLILQGSGNVSMDGDVSGPLLGSGYLGQPARLSQQLAHQFARIGVASLRFSKRGVDDPNELIHQTIPYMMDDSMSALDEIRKKFPNLKIGIVGFSEGALIASMIANKVRPDALFLLSPPTRSIDESLMYQFITWPIDLIRKNIFQGADSIQISSLKKNTKVPLLGPGFTSTDITLFDLNTDGAISIHHELFTAYQSLHSMIHQMLKNSPLKEWYDSMKSVPTFTTLAKQIQTPLFIYQGMDDAQIRWSDVLYDSSFIPGLRATHFYSGLGHCFSPMTGGYGEEKTSGPMDQKLISQIKLDVALALN